MRTSLQLCCVVLLCLPVTLDARPQEPALDKGDGARGGRFEKRSVIAYGDGDIKDGDETPDDDRGDGESGSGPSRCVPLGRCIIIPASRGGGRKDGQPENSDGAGDGSGIGRGRRGGRRIGRGRGRKGGIN